MAVLELPLFSCVFIILKNYHSNWFQIWRWVRTIARNNQMWGLDSSEELKAVRRVEINSAEVGTGIATTKRVVIGSIARWQRPRPDGRYTERMIQETPGNWRTFRCWSNERNPPAWHHLRRHRHRRATSKLHLLSSSWPVIFFFLDPFKILEHLFCFVCFFQNVNGYLFYDLFDDVDDGEVSEILLA